MNLYGEELAPGALVGSFVVERVWFRGVMSALYFAREEGSGRCAALKVLRPELSFSGTALRRFQQEAQTLRALRHPNIVELMDCGELKDGRPYLAMEWLEGRDLAAELAARGYLGLPEVSTLLEQMGGALCAAHRAGIIHRDLKAQNVMVLARSGETSIKLVDFGIAKALAPGPDAPLTTTGRSLGTPIAMAPEQIRSSPADARTDVYALGILLYQLLTGRLPFQAPTALELEELHLFAPAPRPGAIAPVPAAVDEVVRRCLRKRPEERYPSVEALLADWRCAVGTAAPAPTPPPSRAAALYLEVSAAEDAEDAVLDRMDALLEQAQRACAEAKLELRVEGGSFLLATAPLPQAPEEERQGRSRLVALARTLLQSLEVTREGLPIRVALTLHVSPVGEGPGPEGATGDELLHPTRWSRGHPGAGLAATAAVLEGLAEAREAAPVAGAPALLQLEPPAAREKSHERKHP